MTPLVHPDQAQSDYENGNPYRSKMPNWGEPSGSKGSFADPEDYDSSCDESATSTEFFKRATRAPTASPGSTRPPTPQVAPKVTCTHTWRACTGKFGAYWWCRTCSKTKGIYTHRGGILVEDSSLEWLAARNDDLDSKNQALELAHVSSRSKRANNR